MYFRYIVNKLNEIKKWRWILLLFFWSIALYSDIVNYVSVATLSYQEVLVLILNDYFNICYYYLFAIVIVAFDIFSNTYRTYENQIIVKLGSRSKYYFASLLYIVSLSFILLALYVVLSIFLYGIINGGFYSGPLTLVQLGNPNLSAHMGVLLSLSLVLCRFIFIILGMFIINYSTNTTLGFLFAFMITLLDYWFYECFQIMDPLFILPIEHTRIFYTEAVAPAFESMERVLFSISYIYWGGLIGIEMLILKFFIKQKDFVLDMIY